MNDTRHQQIHICIYIVYVVCTLKNNSRGPVTANAATAAAVFVVSAVNHQHIRTSSETVKNDENEIKFVSHELSLVISYADTSKGAYIYRAAIFKQQRGFKYIFTLFLHALIVVATDTKRKIEKCRKSNNRIHRNSKRTSKIFLLSQLKCVLQFYVECEVD